MKPQDDKKQHKITCVAVLFDKPGFVFDCSCGEQWRQMAIDAPHSSSLVKCLCGARAWFDLRTDRRKIIDAGGAFAAAVKSELATHYAGAIDAIKLETP